MQLCRAGLPRVMGNRDFLVHRRHCARRADQPVFRHAVGVLTVHFFHPYLDRI